MQQINRGKMVILAILGVALSAAAFSTWYHYRGSYRAIEFWGPRAARLIAQAPRIRVLQLAGVDEPFSDGSQRIAVGERTFRVVRAQDASRAKGITNIRRALVLDPAFQWNASAPSSPEWKFAFEFEQGDEVVIVLFDFDQRAAASASQTGAVRLNEEASADIHLFFREVLDAPR